MPNFTFKIDNCKIFEYNSKQGKGWGKLCWTDGTIDFDQKFQTTYANVISVIEANRTAEAEFKVSGHLTKSEGYGDHKGKTFTNWVVDNVELIEAKKFNARELVDEALKQHEEDEEIPF